MPACLPLAFLAALALGCGGPLKTGSISRPSDASTEEGACPSDTTLCGIGASVLCTDLQQDPEHCGGCDKACAPGVACASGVCQRVVCQGQPMLSSSPLTLPSLGPGFMNRSVLADVNGDGRLDLITWKFLRSDSDPGSFQVSLGKTGGGFGPVENYEAGKGIWQMAVADINQDRADDLFLSVWTGSTDSSRTNGYHLALWLGNTDGHLAPAPATPAENSNLPLAFADLSGDGKPDLVAFSAEGDALEVYLSDGTGAFHLSGSYGATRTGLPLASGQLLVRDWNGDGFPDLVLPDSSLQFLINRGDGTFDDAVDCGLSLGTGVIVADFDHDGRMDVAGSVGVMLGMGGCRFAPASESCGRALQATDMDGDGQLDLLCLSPSCLLTVLIGNSDGSFQEQSPITLPSTRGSCSTLAGDVTDDRRPDLVLTGGDGSMSIWENTCP